MDKLLASLNTKQKEAVTASASGRLQIIAGPGTGKTTVLVARVAYLILVANIPPQNLIVTTFTKKAAKEMVERLEPVMKESGVDISKLLIGTFHSICYRIIRRYGSKMGMNNFTIADERDSNEVLKDVLKSLTPEEIKVLDSLPEEETADLKSQKAGSEKYHGYNPKSFKKQISKLKSLGNTVAAYEKVSGHNMAVLLVYQKYQSKLQREFLLDFDDCLLHCWSLITKAPVLNFVQHVLVDEFQDTNELQLQLMYEFARGHPSDAQFQHNVTIVGDPDQSIYAFREAQVINFKKMEQFYTKTLNLPFHKISLNENYRSTRDILQISETIMNQQTDRVKKHLNSQHQISFKPVHKTLESMVQEAKWIAYNIVYLKNMPNSAIKYSDIAILVRSAFQTRAIEKELLIQRVPYHMVRGKAFWERPEVTSILDHLRIIVNPFDRMAFLRTLSFPKKGVGEKTQEKINNYLNGCDYEKGDIVDYILEMLSTTTYVTGKAEGSIRSHVSFIKKFRVQAEGIKQEELEEFFEAVFKESGVFDQFKDDESSCDNIREVQAQLVMFDPQDEDLSLYIGGKEDELAADDRNLISKFIASIGLYETLPDEEDKETEGDDDGKVALSTIHGSKGLEWPVVFIPGLSDKLFPSRFALGADNGETKVPLSQSEAINEERRCFYVATTRAKYLLYLSSVVDGSTGEGWGTGFTKVSMFIEGILNKCEERSMFLADFDRLCQLYRVKKVEALPDKSFDLEKYYRSYKKGIQRFLRGASTRIDPFNYEEDQDDYEDENNGRYRTSFARVPAKVPANFSITTAKSIVDIQPAVEDTKIERRRLLQKRKQQKQPTFGGFKAPRPSATSTPKVSQQRSKAPTYVYQAATVLGNTQKGNRAPTYIAKRQATSDSLRKGTE